MSTTESEILSIKQRFGIIGNSALLNQAISVAAQIAPTDMTVLINGESGSGKESFSKIIHQLSAKKHGQFIAINCGAIPEGTIDSELFGHEKGSFTGATDSRKGYFEVTDGGSIFLDEIGEMPLGTQARLLRVLEYGEFIKVGSSKVLKTNVRVIAATNVNLLEQVEKGKFREDLYYRLNNVSIYVPPLRERGDDILLLFRKFASDFSEKYRCKPVQLSELAKISIRDYRFPGNIRQLRSLTEQISVLEMEREISQEVIEKYIPKSSNSLPALYKSESSKDLSERDILYKVLFDMKKDMADLKKLVLNILKNERHGSELIEENQSLFQDLGKVQMPRISEPSSQEKKDPIYLEPKLHELRNYEPDKIEDITHEMEDEDESLSIEKKEKELIIRALQKNNNKRKYAAQNLGISERTLYRKIKQYEIEE